MIFKNFSKKNSETEKKKLWITGNMSFVLLPLIVPVFSSKYTEFFFVVNKVLQTVFVTISLFYKYYQPAKEMSFLKRFI